jgi:hypothetical protein
VSRESLPHVYVSPQPDDQYISLDSIGVAGFSHDFGTLEGKACIVEDALNSLVEERPSVHPWAIALSDAFPFLLNLAAGSRFKKFAAMKDAMADVASDLIERVRREEHEIEHVAGDKSIIGLLSESESHCCISQTILKCLPQSSLKVMMLLRR